VIRFRHNHEGCTSEIIRFLGEALYLEDGTPVAMSSAEWRHPDGRAIDYGSPMVIWCPDCRRRVHIISNNLDQMK
jgi:hypothetical protein